MTLGGSARGRLVVRFSPANWGAIHAELTDLVGEGQVATHRMRSAAPHAARRAAISAFPRIGMAVIDPARAGVTRAQLEKKFHGRVRDEHPLRRTPIHYESSATPTRPWTDDAATCWPLHALGIRPRDNDGEGIVVGVIDTGISIVHPALRTCVLETKSFVPGYRGDDDDLGHGTHVAALVAGAATERPRYGVAPAAKIRGYRIYGSDDATDEVTLIHAIETAADDGCRLLVLATGRAVAAEDERGIEEDTNLGLYLATRGCLLFAAAGNESDRPKAIQPTDAPANAPRIYAIGASTREDGVWNKSNGKFTDVDRRVDWGAPGQYIVSALAGGTTLSASGTSAACAIAVGAAAALWSRQPSLSGAELIRELNLRAAARPNVEPEAIGNGLLRVTNPDGPSSVAPSLRTLRGIMTQSVPDLAVNTNANANAAANDFDAVVDGVTRLRQQNPSARVRVLMIDVLPDGETPATVASADDVVATTTGVTASGLAALRVKWNMSGHSVIAMLAEQILQKENPKVYRKLQDLMDSGTLPVDDGSGIGSLAAWPDRIKAPPRGTPKEFTELGQQHKPDHYINLPYTPPAKTITKLPKPMGEGANVLTALPEWMTKMQNGETPTERLEGLAFVLHLVGDLRQPLHCAVLVNKQFPDGDEGGNSIWFEKSGELHALWDGAIVTSAGNIPKAFAKLQKELDRTRFADQLKTTSLEAWALGTYKHAQTAYDDFLAACPYKGTATRSDRNGRQVSGQQYDAPPPAYRDKARSVAEECGLVAAFRLADLLATILKK
jgi:hypothetical protein